jgi:murein DD-endopeptidase MepM/ murein hydrolase activator NlpD
VVLSHGDDFITLYAHLEDIGVRKGQQVRRGDVIGTVGNTGFSTNPHLHYEIRRRQDDGQLLPVDPRIYMFDLELSDQERVLVANRKAPDLDGYEPLPRLFTR